MISVRQARVHQHFEGLQTAPGGLRWARLNVMLTTFEATVDEHGQIQPIEPVQLTPGERVLITLLDSAPDDVALMSEAALASDWLRPEEEAAWSHLRPGRPC